MIALCALFWRDMAERKLKKVTNLQELADLAGVSRATASRALNDNPVISSKTRRKLQALAAKHGYSINQKARDFRLQRTSVIAVVFMLDIESEQHMSDPFFLDMLGGIADALADHDYDLELCDLCVRQCPIEIRIAQCAAGEPPSGDPNQCPPRHAIALQPRGPGGAMQPVVADGCVGCGVCEMICPPEPAAIVVDIDRVTGGA